MKCRGLLLVFFCWGCSKNTSGPAKTPTTAAEINKAQQVFFEQIDPLLIQQGQFVYFLKTQEVYTGQLNPSTNLMEEESITVDEVSDLSSYLEVTIKKEVIDHLTEGSPHSLFKDVFYLAKGPAPVDDGGDSSPANSQVQFYNLKTADILVNKPEQVLQKEPCTDPQGCQLRVKKISYEIALEDPQNPRATQVEIWLSADVPYFATILRSCYTTVVTIDSSRPLVRQCKSVFDYRWKQL